MSAHTRTWPGSSTRQQIQSKASFRRRKVSNAVLLTITGLFTVLALLPLFWIIAYVAYKGGQYISLDFFIHLPAALGEAGGGVLNAIEGTLVLTVLASLFAVLPGILAAFYVAYKPNTLFGTMVRFGTDVLSGVPSIIIGVLCYAVVVKSMGHYSALAGGVALAILMLPTIIRTTEEMIRLVPHSMREGALALGSPEWKTALSITLPAASKGIITGILLGIARASGETAPLLFTALGNENYDIGGIIQSGVANHQGLITIVGNIVNQPVDSLPLTLWKYAQQPYPERMHQAWAVALVLMIVVLSINILTRVWVQTRSHRMQGK
ncbi:MAG TPA: phosphate ABC transporter permease PstA [Anaerolineales bacterium]|nr:phosphate ABC transporter permease PstA [Anaerolineales bacterium]